MTMLDYVQKRVEQIKKAIQEGKMVVIAKGKVKDIEIIPTDRSYMVRIVYEDGTDRMYYATDFMKRKVEIL